MRLAGSKPSTSCAKRGITQMSRSSRIRRAKRSSQMGAAAVNLARLAAASSSSLSVRSMRNCGGACKHRNIDTVPSCTNPLSRSYATCAGATAMWMLRGHNCANPQISQIRSVAKTASPTMCQWTFSVNHKSETQTQDSVLAVALTIHTGQHTANRQCIIPT